MAVTPGSPTAAEWHLTETYKGLITISVEGLKTLALINGGAAIAILTYLGNLLAHPPVPAHTAQIGSALLCYSGSLLATVLAFIAAYMAQLRLFQEEISRRNGVPLRRLHNVFLTLGLLLSVGAAVGFGIGCFKTAEALLP